MEDTYHQQYQYQQQHHSNHHHQNNNNSGNSNHSSGNNSNSGTANNYRTITCCGNSNSNTGWGARSVDLYERIEQIGEGTFGQVYKAKNKLTDEVVALKKVLMENESEGFPITAIREIKILKELDHKNVVKLKEIVTSKASPANNGKGSVYMVFEFMDHDLNGLMDSPVFKFFQPDQVKCYLKQLLEGLDYCHRNNVLHRDNKESIIRDIPFGVETVNFGYDTYKVDKTIPNGFPSSVKKFIFNSDKSISALGFKIPNTVEEVVIKLYCRDQFSTRWIPDSVKSLTVSSGVLRDVFNLPKSITNLCLTRNENIVELQVRKIYDNHYLIFGQSRINFNAAIVSRIRSYLPVVDSLTIKSIWSVLKDSSLHIQSLTSKESEISQHISELHEYLRVIEHKLKKSINDDIDTHNQQVNQLLNELKYLVDINNSNNIIINNKEYNVNNNNNSSSSNNEFEEIKPDITDDYSLSTIIKSINENSTLISFIENNRVVFDQQKQQQDHISIIVNQYYNNNSDSWLLDSIYKYSKQFNPQRQLQIVQPFNIYTIKFDIQPFRSMIHKSISVTKPNQTKNTIFSLHRNGATLIHFVDDDYFHTEEVEFPEGHILDLRNTTMSTALVGEDIYIFSGFNAGSSKLIKYNIKAKSFSVVEDVKNLTRYYGVSLCYDGDDHIYLVGGNRDSRPDPTIESFNVHTKRLKIKEPSFKNYSNKVISVYHRRDGWIYTVPSDVPLVIAFNPISMESVEYRFNDLECAYSGCTDDDGNIYVLNHRKYFIRFNMDTKQFQRLESIEFYINYLSMVYRKVSPSKNFIYLLTGSRENLRYSVEQNKWEPFFENDEIDRKRFGKQLIEEIPLSIGSIEIGTNGSDSEEIQPFKRDDLPSTLEILILGESFKFPIEPCVLPSSLKVLEYYGGKHTLKAGSLPLNLEEFQYHGDSLLPFEDDGVLPLTLAILKAPLSCLPSIKSLPNLKSLILTICRVHQFFDFPYVPGRLISSMPPSIKHLDLTQFSYDIDEIFKDRSQYQIEYLMVDELKMEFHLHRRT
ncbi:hypothetical protein PPL_06551 [Heterostelium album PN500]|uniref:Protein kinase domain-containing protein n=1 Tax=Heterostelium pallidum (strain ATCC 26659 / Pp 5 / PN500) TaxID=670386 RepID=D3BDG8_HETP5|nr:hypothetical protein PPL_06551 [Heterostelium album PN500]EFA80612.1 hypothetical protein PPL_06551 [Heterostelium album PN500]|eukprot:XP_020432732.1 hypothetical protein PPL_06551 [Heterostelium album PN500]